MGSGTYVGHKRVEQDEVEESVRIVTPPPAPKPTHKKRPADQAEVIEEIAALITGIVGSCRPENRAGQSCYCRRV